MMERVFKSATIPVPQRMPPSASIAVLLIICTMCLAFVMPAAKTYALAVMSLLLLLTAVCRYFYAVHLSLFAFLLFLTAQFDAAAGSWPLNLLIPLAVYSVTVSLVPGLRKSLNWLKRGNSDSRVILLVIVTVVFSAAALAGWVRLARPDLSRHAALLPEMPLWLYPLAGAGFAFLNSLMEEAVFRGIVMEALDSAFGAGFMSTGLQAASFAAFHYLAGFPNGVWGFLMVFVYGVALGTIRRMSKGMLAPMSAHFAADITIFALLIFSFP